MRGIGLGLKGADLGPMWGEILPLEVGGESEGIPQLAGWDLGTK